jgi:hypothetical protein
MGPVGWLLRDCRELRTEQRVSRVHQILLPKRKHLGVIWLLLIRERHCRERLQFRDFFSETKIRNSTYEWTYAFQPGGENFEKRGPRSRIASRRGKGGWVLRRQVPDSQLDVFSGFYPPCPFFRPNALFPATEIVAWA